MQHERFISCMIWARRLTLTETKYSNVAYPYCDIVSYDTLYIFLTLHAVPSAYRTIHSALWRWSVESQLWLFYICALTWVCNRLWCTKDTMMRNARKHAMESLWYGFNTFPKRHWMYLVPLYIFLNGMCVIECHESYIQKRTNCYDTSLFETH
jgi:hypothetical protein